MAHSVLDTKYRGYPLDLSVSLAFRKLRQELSDQSITHLFACTIAAMDAWIYRVLVWPAQGTYEQETSAIAVQPHNTVAALFMAGA